MTRKLGPWGRYSNTPLKVAKIDTQTKTDAKPVEFFLLTYFGGQNGPTIGPLRPILYTSLKVAPMTIQGKIDVNAEETC